MTTLLETLGGVTVVESRGAAIFRCPLEVVWEAIGRPENISTWDPSVLSMTPTTDGPQRVGSKYRVRSRTGKKEHDRIEEVVAFEEGVCRVIRCHVPMMPFEVASRVEWHDPFTVCSFHSRVFLQGPTRLMARIVTHYGDMNVREALRALKVHLAQRKAD